MKRKSRRPTVDEQIKVLAQIERCGDILLLSRLLANDFSDLANSDSKEIRVRFARWQDVAPQGLAVEAKGEGALLKLDDPLYVEMRAEGLMNQRHVRNAEAYAGPLSSGTLNFPS